MKLNHDALVDGLLTMGATMVSCGAGMLHLAAGLIVAGGFLMLGGVLVSRNPPSDKEGSGDQ